MTTVEKSLILQNRPGENEEIEIAHRLVDSGIEYLITNDCDLSRIELDTLDISDPIDCVLGQLFGSYSIGFVSLDVWTPELFGFCAGEHDSYFIDSRLLTEVWKIKLREQQNA